jgi:hypothetical protein
MERRFVPMRSFLTATAVLSISTFLSGLGCMAAETKPPGIVILRGNPMGGVTFDHPAHAERADKRCEVCHHASKPEKPLAAPHESCFDCHTSPPTPAVKVNRQGAFHNPAATAGTCIDCHKRSNAMGMKAPTRCTDCHKKANG